MRCFQSPSLFTTIPNEFCPVSARIFSEKGSTLRSFQNLYSFWAEIHSSRVSPHLLEHYPILWAMSKKKKKKGNRRGGKGKGEEKGKEIKGKGREGKRQVLLSNSPLKSMKTSIMGSASIHHDYPVTHTCTCKHTFVFQDKHDHFFKLVHCGMVCSPFPRLVAYQFVHIPQNTYPDGGNNGE